MSAINAALQTWKAVESTLDKSTTADLLEHFVEQLYRHTLSSGDIAIDVGAHRGRHTIPMAECVGTSGKVYGVEASSVTLKKLNSTLKQAERNISSTIAIIPKAVGNTTGTVEFNYVPEAPGMSGLMVQNYPVEAHPETETVELVKLDEEIPEHDQIKFIKLDIEGGEFNALNGATDILTKSRPVIVYEWGGAAAAERYGFTAQQFFEFMKDMNYDIYSALGFKFRPEHWDQGNVYYFVGLPGENEAAYEEILLPSLIKAILKY